MQDKLQIDGSFLLLLALMVLVLPIEWVTAALSAAAVHELSHYLALRLVGGRVHSLKIGAGGTVMETSPLSPREECFCALAGPAGSLGLLLFARWLPRMAICAGMQGLFNLLPVYPLDGGRALSSIAGEFVCRVVEIITLIGILIAAVSAYAMGIFAWYPLLLAGFCIVRALLRKIPCKEPK